MGHWEIIALAMGDAPVGTGWEPFAVGNVENEHGELEQKVYWRCPPEDSDESEWYSTRDACKILKVTPPTLHRMSELGQVPKPVKIGAGVRGRWRWSARGIKALVNKAG